VFVPSPLPPHHSLPPASVWVPPGTKGGGGAQSPAGEGWGCFSKDDWRKSLSLRLLCGSYFFILKTTFKLCIAHLEMPEKKTLFCFLLLITGSFLITKDKCQTNIYPDIITRWKYWIHSYMACLVFCSCLLLKNCLQHSSSQFHSPLLTPDWRDKVDRVVVPAYQAGAGSTTTLCHSPPSQGLWIWLQSKKDMQRTNTENSKQIIPEKELQGHRPSFQIHVSVRIWYIPRSICLFCEWK
jgi:hypothetical protein